MQGTVRTGGIILDRFRVEHNWSRSTLLWWWEKNSRALNVFSERSELSSVQSSWDIKAMSLSESYSDSELPTPKKKKEYKNKYFEKLREDVPWLTSYSSVQQHRPFPVPVWQKVCYKSSSNAWSAWSYIPLVSGNVGPRTYLGFLRYIGPVDGSWPKTELRSGPW